MHHKHSSVFPNISDINLIQFHKPPIQKITFVVTNAMEVSHSNKKNDAMDSRVCFTKIISLKSRIKLDIFMFNFVCNNMVQISQKTRNA